LEFAEVECGPCPDFASNTLAFALQLIKITEHLSLGNRRALGWLAPNAIRLVDFHSVNVIFVLLGC